MSDGQITEASPAEDTDVNPAADPSPAETTENEAPARSLLDVVQDAVNEAPEVTEESSASDAEKADPEKDDGDDAPAAEEPENFDGLPFGRHPRFKQLVEERNTLRTKTTEQEAAIQRLEGPADQYNRIENFMRENDISAQEVVDLYKFGALFKNDPEQALTMIQPYVADLYQRTGRLLSQDLQQDVEEGRITEERARELSQERARAALHEERAGKAQARAETVSTETAEANRAAEMRNTLVDWDARMKAKDPDFAAKEDMIADRCAAIIHAEGKPATTDAMISVLDRAHKDVTDRLRALRPPPKPTRSAPNPTTSSTVSAQPKSLKEAIELAAAQGT